MSWSILNCSVPAVVVGTPITSVSFATPYIYNSTYPTHSVGTDSFYSTWADDGNIYSATNDMIAGWDGASGSSNMTIAKLSTFTSSVVGTMVNPLTQFGSIEQTGSDTFNYKATGLISIGGVQYMAVGRMQIPGSPSFLQFQRDAQIIKSTDRWATNGYTPQPPSQAQQFASPMFPGTTFAMPSPIQYGQDYQGNTVDNSNLYVYWMSPTAGRWYNADAVIIARVLISDIASLDATKYTYYKGNGADGMLSSNWDSSVTNATPIISHTGSLGAGGAQYIPHSGRYLYIGTVYPTVNLPTPSLDTSSTQFTIFEAPHPWGPWTLLNTVVWNPLGLYFPAVIPKSTTADNGVTIVAAMAGNYNLQSIVNGDYTLMLTTGTVNN